MELKEIISNFQIDGNYIEDERIYGGHINETYKVKVSNPLHPFYIVQKINTYAFREPLKLVENAMLVSEHIKRGDPTFSSLNFIKTKDDNYCLCYKDEYYKVYEYVDDALSYNELEDLNLIKEEGIGFGSFQKALSSFNASLLNITIKDFHNTHKRYEYFKEVINKDPLGRVSEVKEEINYLLGVENILSFLSIKYDNKELNIRPAHNDTKCNNILFDKETHKAKCVIDLDTLMPGLLVFDYGDAIRSACTSTREDNPNLNEVYLDINKFKAFSLGFLGETKDILTQDEKDYLILGAITMIGEVALRFLTDYIDGDKYFHISYNKQNLYRTQNQIKLLQDTLAKKDLLKDIVEGIINE